MWQLPLPALWSLSCQLSTFVFKWQNWNFHRHHRKRGRRRRFVFVHPQQWGRLFPRLEREVAGAKFSSSWAQAIVYRAAVWIVPILPSLCCCIAYYLELSKRDQWLTLLLQMGRFRLREGAWAAQHWEAEGGLGIKPSLPWSGANAAGTRPNQSPRRGGGSGGGEQADLALLVEADSQSQVTFVPVFKLFQVGQIENNRFVRNGFFPCTARVLETMKGLLFHFTEW